MANVGAIVAAALLAGACAAAQADAGAPQDSAKLPANLPLRRDVSVAPDASTWGPSALLALAAAGGGWAWWRRAGRQPGRRASSARPEQVVRVSSQALTAQASVHAVRWQGEELLIACTAQQVTVLARRPADAPAGEQA